MQRVEKPSGATVSETRLRGCSVASEPRSRSSSLNPTDSGSGPQAAPGLGKGSQPASQRFSAISSEDFDQELVVMPLKVRKKRRRKTGAPTAARTAAPLLSGGPHRAPRERCSSEKQSGSSGNERSPPSKEFHCEIIHISEKNTTHTCKVSVCGLNDTTCLMGLGFLLFNI